MHVSKRAGVAVAVLAMALTACTVTASPSPTQAPTSAPGTTAPSTPTPAPALTKVRYGLPTAPPAITTVGVYYALDNGYFAEQGLDVEVIPYPGSTTATRALLSESADIVLVGGDTAFLAWQNGAPIKIINAPVAKGTDVMVSGKGITTVAQLAGKRFAISDPGSTAEVLGRIYLERNNVNPAGMQFVSIGSPADRIRALIAGTADVTAATIVVLQPILDAIAKGEATVLTSFAKEFPDIPLAYNIATDKMIAAKPDLLVKFLTAELKGYRWAVANPDAAAAIMVKYVPNTALPLMTTGFKQLVDLKVYGLDGGISGDQIAKTMANLVTIKKLSAALKLEDVSNQTLIQQAIKALGG